MFAHGCIPSPTHRSLLVLLCVLVPRNAAVPDSAHFEFYVVRSPTSKIQTVQSLVQQHYEASGKHKKSMPILRFENPMGGVVKVWPKV